MLRSIVQILGVLTLLAGVYFFMNALTIPARYTLSAASAVQITQVYSEATYNGIMAVAAFTLAGILILGSREE